MHWCESVCPHEVRHRSHIERHINVFVFTLFFSLSFASSLCDFAVIPFKFANVSSVGMWFCQLLFFSPNAMAFIVLSIPRLNCGLSFAFFFLSPLFRLCVSFLLFFIRIWIDLQSSELLWCISISAAIDYSMSEWIGFIWVFLSTVRYHKQSWSQRFHMCMVFVVWLLKWGWNKSAHKRTFLLSLEQSPFFSHFAPCASQILMWNDLLWPHWRFHLSTGKFNFVHNKA